MNWGGETHQIRLRGPWEVAFHGDFDLTEVEFVRCSFPDEVRGLLPSTGPTAVLFRRRFHRPTGLDAQTRVMLQVEDLEITQVSLNGQVLKREVNSPTKQQFDITNQLLPNNELVLLWPVEDCELARASVERANVVLSIASPGKL